MNFIIVLELIVMARPSYNLTSHEFAQQISEHGQSNSPCIWQISKNFAQIDVYSGKKPYVALTLEQAWNGGYGITLIVSKHKETITISKTVLVQISGKNTTQRKRIIFRGGSENSGEEENIIRIDSASTGDIIVQNIETREWNGGLIRCDGGKSVALREDVFIGGGIIVLNTDQILDIQSNYEFIGDGMNVPIDQFVTVMNGFVNIINSPFKKGFANDANNNPSLTATTQITNQDFGSNGRKAITVTGSSNRYEIINCTFTNCKNNNLDAGALHLTLTNGGQFLVLNTTFTNCEPTQGSGGAIFAQIQSGSTLTIGNACKFIECKCGYYGGAVLAQINGSNSQLIIEDQILFEKCQGRYCGGLFINTVIGSATINGNCLFKECESRDECGGGLQIYLQPETEVQIKGEIIFENCKCLYNNGGGAFVALQSNSQLQINRMTFINCFSLSGGGLCIYKTGIGYKLDIQDEIIFNNCSATNNGGGIYAEILNGYVIMNGLKIIDCQSAEGAGIYSIIKSSGTLTINGQSLIQNCTSKTRTGGGIYIQIYDSASQCIISGQLDIKDCSSKTTGGGLQTDIRLGEITVSGIYIDNCQSNSGGSGLNSSLISGGKLTIKDQSVFTNCRSISGSGGGMYSYIDNGKLSLDDVSLSYCSCSQPYNGGALYIALFSTYSNISITNSSFKYCQTNSSSSQKYGWGGAIFILIDYDESHQISTRFNLTQNVFEGNLAAGMGQNIHIQSPNVLETGLQISQDSLLTVNGSSDLYTSPSYAYDYMGIDNSVNSNDPGTNSYDKHRSLFMMSSFQIIPNPSYIDANNGLDNLQYCGEIEFSCKQISYAINRGSGLPTNANYVLIILSDSTSDSNLQINIPTINWNYITIQSDGYTEVSQINANPKYQIPTSSQSNSLFTITANGHLDLIGVQFNNLNPTSLNPLFSVQSPNNDQIPILSINSCEFKQDPTQYPDNSISHCLIFINGGKLTISKSIIKDYQLSDEKSSIMIYSDISSTSEVYRMNQIDIINSTFENIKQVEGSGSGTCINAELNAGSIMNISQSCTFTNCISRTTGGAIQIIQSGGHIKLNEVIIKGCKGTNGGAIYIDIDFASHFEFIIIDTQILECTAKANTSSTSPSGFGGGIFLIGSGDYDPLTENLDFRGMKIYNNSADNGGQSLYLFMSKLAQLCQYSIAGEYVKGNYSDITSYLCELQGVPINFSAFYSSTIAQIKQQQYYLESYWNLNVNQNKFICPFPLIDCTNLIDKTKLQCECITDDPRTSICPHQIDCTDITGKTKLECPCKDNNDTRQECKKDQDDEQQDDQDDKKEEKELDIVDEDDEDPNKKFKSSATTFVVIMNVQIAVQVVLVDVLIAVQVVLVDVLIAVQVVLVDVLIAVQVVLVDVLITVQAVLNNVLIAVQVVLVDVLIAVQVAQKVVAKVVR
ncbi:MAG: hypothetical protein EZS28_020378 [Streblomastix strix]|uniref:Uncharacterized protein n=1 Tax=Streblomastix strix TaxID=222440 RepID=A0A5J4VP01_9EUKA|nr:MAG: hypothetical protein EZS28_020378 [Streblomastix strix]